MADHKEHQGDGESVEDDLGREQDSGVCVTVSVLLICEGRNSECSEAWNNYQDRARRW